MLLIAHPRVANNDKAAAQVAVARAADPAISADKLATLLTNALQQVVVVVLAAAADTHPKTTTMAAEATEVVAAVATAAAATEEIINIWYFIW